MRKRHNYKERLKYMKMLEEGYSINFIHKQYGINGDLLFTLWKQYKAHEAAALIKKKNCCLSVEEKMSGIAELREKRVSLHAIMLNHGVSESAILNWRRRYGYRRVTTPLHNEGVVINHKTVQKLMGADGAQGEAHEIEVSVVQRRGRQCCAERPQPGFSRFKAKPEMGHRCHTGQHQGRHALKHVAQGQLPRQCHDGEFFRPHEKRIAIFARLELRQRVRKRAYGLHKLL